MFNHILELLTGRDESPERGGSKSLQIAVAALLVQAAAMDDHFDAVERTTIRRLLSRRFDLADPEVDRLFAEAESASARSTQLYPFIRVAVKQLDEAGRVAVIEMLWEVAYADGVLDPDEDALVRRIAGLIYVSDHDRGAARKRVLERLEIDGKRESP
jgi:uncharacterized tellurite resistance protein B-like protein